ncbi:hypothetical protein H696_04919 [Fonticula alba]|uniref:Alpha-soluble NSF attachment protein n=1 Tax=Fonticula alba TaxID=691883 RepID=A0A058Z3X8_FONAL|nr:hypothetical protein H696_04919 [Fonticula alba]KCV68628.1 hypothetical protein H696_04919 [Fonticula alba]|eukprot:XP_009497060.1 hypothetical protein H696_04919 [Fonticula alba]
MTIRIDHPKYLEAKRMLEPRFFGMISPSADRYEEAAELFNRTANDFRKQSKLEEAAQCFRDAATAFKMAGSEFEVSVAMTNAANAYRQMASHDANMARQMVDCLENASAILLDMGRFSMAARHKKDIAEAHENILNAPRPAIEAYQKAAEWYRMDNSKHTALSCLAKCATLHATLREFPQSIACFEELIDSHNSDNSGRLTCRQYYTPLVIVMIVEALTNPAKANHDPTEAAREKLDYFNSIDSSFNRTRENQLLNDLLEAIDNRSRDELATAVAEYMRMASLDNWTTDLLLLAKNSLPEDAVGGSKGDFDGIL